MLQFQHTRFLQQRGRRRAEGQTELRKQEIASLYGLIRKRQSSVDWNDCVTKCEAFRGCSEWSFLIFKLFLQILKMPKPGGYSAKKGAF